VVCLYFSYEHRTCICSPHLSHTPLSRTLFVILTLRCHVLISVTPLLHLCALSSTFASSNILCAFPPLCFLATPVSGDTPFPATRTLGDTYVGRRSLLVMRTLGDAYAWRRLSPPRVFVFYLFTPWSCTSSGKKIKTEARFFLNFFSFYLGDLVKKPPRGKKSVPYNKIVTWLLTYIIQLK